MAIRLQAPAVVATPFMPGSAAERAPHAIAATRACEPAHAAPGGARACRDPALERCHARDSLQYEAECRGGEAQDRLGDAVDDQLPCV